MVEAGPSTRNEKEVKTDWPVDEGLTAGTTKLRKEKRLKPQEKSFLTRNSLVGLETKSG